MVHSDQEEGEARRRSALFSGEEEEEVLGFLLGDDLPEPGDGVEEGGRPRFLVAVVEGGVEGVG